MRKVSLLLILLLLVGCDNKEKINIVDFEISSPVENQIQHIDEFRLDKIWLDVNYGDYTEQVILTEDMINTSDLAKLNSIGEHNISINIGDISKEIFIVIYSELSENYYCINYEGETKVVLANSIYEIAAPSKMGSYFAGWFVDEELSIPYDGGDGVVNLYPKFSLTKTYRVRFFHQNLIIKEEYVKEGESANPPIMNSYNDYTFSHWDQDFTCINENIDINAIYLNGYYEVKFYDGDNNLIDRQVVKKGDSADAPIIEEVDGKKFIGWSVDFSFVNNSINVYPLYSYGEYYCRVRFYKDEISEENFLYEEIVKKGDSLEFNYEIDNYIFDSLSCSLDNIKEDLNVICEYSPVMISYFINDKLFTILPFYMPHPEHGRNDLSDWKKNKDDDYRYDSYTIDIDIQLCFNGESILVSLKEFLEYDPRFYLGILKEEFLIYEWYYDNEFINKVEDFYNLENVTLYGKLNLNLDRNLSGFCNLKLIEIGGVFGYRIEEINMVDKKVAYIPSYYNGYPILSISYEYLGFAEYIFIGSNLMDFYYYEDYISHHDRKTTNIFVHKDNKVVFTKDKGLFLKREFGNELITYPCTQKDIIYTIPENTIIRKSAFSSCDIKELYIEDGCVISGYFGAKNIDKIYFGKGVKNLYYGIHSSDYKYDEIVIEDESIMEYFNVDILQGYTKKFVLPLSVKYMDYIMFVPNSLEVLLYDNLIIPENHSYFKVVDNMILDSTGTVFIGFYRQKQYDEFIVPEYIEYLFAGCFNYADIDRLVLHENLSVTTAYNGITSIKDSNDYAYYIGDFNYQYFKNAKIDELITFDSIDSELKTIIYNSNIENVIWK